MQLKDIMRFLVLIGALLFAAATAASAQILPSALQDAFGVQRPVAREGQATQAEGGPATPRAVGEQARATPPATLQPFGANLFSSTAAPGSDVVNPAYRIQVGDRISLRLYGGTNSEQVVTVDPQGNVFVPEAGLIRVQGVTAGELQALMAREARRVFTDEVSIYAVLLTPQQTGVFVAGAVARPGRYFGSSTDTVIDYLVRAGGVDPARGSYRDIIVSRSGQPIGRIDLYPFLLTGVLDAPSLREGDTIVVGPQRAMVAVDGAVRNNYLFEVSAGASGREIIDLARPLPAATHVSLRGSRDGRPFSLYATAAELAATPVSDQDRITFVADAPTDRITVRIEGSRLGPSVQTVANTASLLEVLGSVRVDETLADKSSAYILRRSVAEQQSRAMQETLDRLERGLFLAQSPTSGVAQIQATEANLVRAYIDRGRRATPDGRIVVVREDGSPLDVRLEDDDVIVIPKRSQTVLVAGEVLAPQAIVFDPRLRRQDYIAKAGGAAEHGRTGRFLIRRASGALIMDKDVPIRPGDELIVLPDLNRRNIQLGSDLLALVYQLAVVANVFN